MKKEKPFCSDFYLKAGSCYKNTAQSLLNSWRWGIDCQGTLAALSALFCLEGKIGTG